MEVKIPKEMIIVSETDEKGIILYANSDFAKSLVILWKS